MEGVFPSAHSESDGEREGQVDNPTPGRTYNPFGFKWSGPYQ